MVWVVSVVLLRFWNIWGGGGKCCCWVWVEEWLGDRWINDLMIDLMIDELIF
jgi:hypothetical protein